MDKLASLIDCLPASIGTENLDNGDFRMIFPDHDPNVLVREEGDTTVFHIEFKEASPHVGFNRLSVYATSEELEAFEKQDVKSRSTSHAHDCFFLVYVQEGKDIEWMEGRLLTIHPGDLLLLTPFALHTNVIPVGSRVLYMYIDAQMLYRTVFPITSESVLFSDFFSDFLVNAEDKKALLFSSCSELVSKVLEDLLAEYLSPAPLYNALIQCKVAELIIALARETVPVFFHFEDSMESQVQEILTYISRNYQTVTLKETAKAFGYHPAYLSSLIHRATGKTFTRLILDQRMTQAVYYLRQGNLSIYEVALACGYREVSSFYKAFTKKFGCSPRSFITEG